MLRTICQTFASQLNALSSRGIATSAALSAYQKHTLPPCKNWARKNEVIHPPEAPVTPYVCHHRSQIHYGLKKMLPISWMVRGLSIDEAIAQLQFDVRKGAKVVKEVLEEAKSLAVEKHGVEFKSNLWVAESFVTKGKYLKGLRKHARGRYGHIEYRYCHYYVRLVEGPPPQHYYDAPLTPSEKLQQYIKNLNDRHVIYSL